MLVSLLTHWGRLTHICVGKPTIIGSDNGLSPGQRQAIIWTNAGILLIGPLETKFSEISIRIQTLSFKKMHLKMSFAKWRPFCLSLNVLNHAHCCITPSVWSNATIVTDATNTTWPPHQAISHLHPGIMGVYSGSQLSQQQLASINSVCFILYMQNYFEKM